MSGRYLYKAKRTDNGEWVEGHLITDEQNKDKCFIGYVFGTNDDGTPHDFDVVPVNLSTICQCTGIPDKKGKRIFEKSIVRDEYGSLGIVEYGVFDYYNIGFYIRWLSESAEYYREELGYWANKVEVIGNVFDNPELMEVKE